MSIQTAIKKLKNKTISNEERAMILNFLLESVEALPIKDIFTYNLDRTLRVNDKALSAEQSIALRESIVALNKNWSYKLIQEQILYEAVKMGIHNSTDMGGVLFSKAAVWIIGQQRILISELGVEESV